MINQYNVVSKIVIYNEDHKILKRYKINRKGAPNFNKVKSTQEVDKMRNTKKRIKDIILSNSFTHFITLTIDKNKSDRSSIIQSSKIIKLHFETIKRKYPDFHYLLICEYHSDNVNIHYHGVIKNYPNIIDNQIPYFNKKLGYNSVTEIKSQQRVTSYVLKYITKTMLKIGKQYYISSRNLNKPIIEQANYNDVYVWDYVSKKIYYNEKRLNQEEYEHYRLTKYNDNI